MRLTFRIFSAVLLLAVGGAGGVLSATTYRPQLEQLISSTIGLVSNASSRERTIIYYRNPMGEPDISSDPPQGDGSDSTRANQGEWR